MANDKSELKFEKDISIIFNPKTIIENYTVWEKIIELFVVNNHSEALTNFIYKILKSISSLEIDNTEPKDCFENTNLIKKSLLLFLRAALIRSLALNWKKEFDIIIKQTHKTLKKEKSLKDFSLLFNETLLGKLRESYCNTRMIDKYVMPIPIDAFLEKGVFQNNKKINMTCFTEVVSVLANKKMKFENYRFTPYIVTMHDLSIFYMIRELTEISASKKNHITSPKKSLHFQKNKYLSINYNNPSNKIKLKFEPKIKAIKHSKRNHTKNYVIKIGNEKKDELNFAIANAKISKDDFESALKNQPNRSRLRYKMLSKLINQSIEENADVLIMPESYVPFEWLSTIARTCAKNDLAVITGIEHVKIKNKIFNLTAIILPFFDGTTQSAYISFHLKIYYSPNEKQIIEGYRMTPVPGDHYELYYWKNCWFPVYCCYELASISDRSIFHSYADCLIAVEWNQDTNYFSNILESLSRDLHCYCIQSNSADYGDSRITKPSSTETKDIIKTKGGKNVTILVDKLNIKDLRNFQLKEYELQKDDKSFKPTPPVFNKKMVELKLENKLWKYMKKKRE